jgi:NAD+ diphosphatase
MTHPFAFQRPFLPLCTTSASGSALRHWFIFKEDRLLFRNHDDRITLPCCDLPPFSAEEIIYSRCIGVYDGTICMVAELKADIPPREDHFFTGLRQAHAHLSADLWAIAGRASQVLTWHHHNRFCGACGAAMEENSDELLKCCPQCDFTAYPRLSPAVIMAVTKGNTILLGRSSRFPGKMYSTLAGFVEAGETLEDAVIREVQEEAGIEVTDVRYVGSQSWPFPHSLMLGFTAEYAGGTLELDNDELEDAGWFAPDNLPELPMKISIARKLIDYFLEVQKRSGI